MDTNFVMDSPEMMRHLMGLTLPNGYNWFLILVAAVIGVIVLAVCVYILVEYSHPEDRNQAWFPKFIVVIGLSLAILSVLLFPLDVANTDACAQSVSPSSCKYTLPMKQLWWSVFIGNLVLVWAIIPFTLFFYEADSDFTLFQRIKSAIIWTLGFLVFIIVVVGLFYGLYGYVEYPTQQLTSGIVNMTLLNNVSALNTICIKPRIYTATNTTAAVVLDSQCDGFGPTYVSSTWTLRTSLPVYIMAIQSVLGWILFLIFAGVGVAAGPIDWIQQFINRPTSVITKSEYMRRARIIAIRAKEVAATARVMKGQDKDRRWRSNLSRLNREVVGLEDDEYALERVFPQGEDGDVRWVFYVISFYATGFLGVIGVGISLAWVAHIIVFMLPPTPYSPFLNQLFTVLDAVFSLFGVLAFAGFCLYLMAISIKGNFMLGMNFGLINLYPMRPGATMMSAFLVNTGVILAMVPAIIQFCAQAFSVYADGTEIFDVFGNQVTYLQGIKYIYNYSIFLYAMLAVALLACIYMAVRSKQVWKRKNPNDAYNY